MHEVLQMRLGAVHDLSQDFGEMLVIDPDLPRAPELQRALLQEIPAPHKQGKRDISVSEVREARERVSVQSARVLVSDCLL